MKIQFVNLLFLYVTGNPVRKEIENLVENKNEAYKFFNINESKKT